MGGPGSGVWYRWDKREYLDDHISLDIRRWKRDGLIWIGNSFVSKWSINGETTSSIRIRVEDHRVVLEYRQRVYGGDWHNIEERVYLTYTDCNYGGSRVWFLCPSCDQRVAKLFSQVPYFVCRQCCDLPYQSQGETRDDRAMRKARKIRHRLGASTSLLDPIWEKPKGMHWRTFERLQQEALQAEQISWIEAVARLPGLKEYLPNS